MQRRVRVHTGAVLSAISMKSVQFLVLCIATCPAIAPCTCTGLRSYVQQFGTYGPVRTDPRLQTCTYRFVRTDPYVQTRPYKLLVQTRCHFHALVDKKKKQFRGLCIEGWAWAGRELFWLGIKGQRLVSGLGASWAKAGQELGEGWAGLGLGKGWAGLGEGWAWTGQGFRGLGEGWT